VGVGVVVSLDVLGECVGVGECGFWCWTYIDWVKDEYGVCGLMRVWR